MKKGTYIDYYVIMAALSSKRKKKQQHSIDTLIAKACGGEKNAAEVSAASINEWCEN